MKATVAKKSAPRKSAPKKTVLATGAAVFVRTVTNYYTGTVVGVDKTWLRLKDAAWVADTGRFSVALAKGELSEIEPYPDGEVLVALGAIVDVCPWQHKLPRETK